MESENYLTTPQVATRLGVSIRRVQALIQAGRLPSRQFGRDHIINEADLALVADRKTGRPKKPGESETAAPTASVTATAAQPKKATGKGAATEKKPAKKQAVKKRG